MITADCGGSNDPRRWTWKKHLATFALESGLEITVCHFPPGTSKVGEPEGFAPSGSHRSVRDDLSSYGSCRPDHQVKEGELVHLHCANIPGRRLAALWKAVMAFLVARNRLYLLRSQRTR